MTYSTGWAQNAPDPCRIVLDTNVVLDWLLFCDPRCINLSAALACGRFCLASDVLCLAELEDVLSRPKICDDPSLARTIVNAYKAHARPIELATLQTSDIQVADLPQCRDPSDQKFLELASRSGAHVLVTRDRELLVLAKPSWSLLNLAIVSLDEASAGINEVMACSAAPAAT